MKFRSGFVTNSSSSSFICEVCGEAEGGYDISITDCEMAECGNGHTMCERHFIDNPKEAQKIRYLKAIKPELTTFPFYRLTESEIDKLLKDSGVKSFEEELNEDPYDIPWLYCPICNLEYITPEMKLRYLMEKSSLTDDIIEKELRSQFSTLGELRNFLNGKKTN